MPLSRREFVGGAAALAVAQFFGLSEAQAAEVVVDAQSVLPDDALVFVIHGEGPTRYMTIEGKVDQQFDLEYHQDFDVANFEWGSVPQRLVTGTSLTFTTRQPFFIRMEAD